MNDSGLNVVEAETKDCVAGFWRCKCADYYGPYELKSFSRIVIQYSIRKILLGCRHAQTVVVFFGGLCYTQNIIKLITCRKGCVV